MKGNPVRKTILFGAAGAIVCAAGLLVWALAATSDRVAWPLDGTGRLLWALRGETADGVGTVALGVLSLSAGGCCALSVPSDLSVKGRDGRLVELGELVESAGWPACCDAVSELLGVPVDGYVVFRWDDAVALCDAACPITVDVPAPVSFRASAKGGTELTIARGRQELSGEQALAYVAGVSEKESPAVRTARVLRALLASSGGDVSSRALGRVRANLTAADLSAVWRALWRGRDSLTSHDVPTSVVVRDGEARRVALVVETRTLVASAVRAKPLLTAGSVSVAVFNGSGARLAATKAAQYLEARGFRIMSVGNADAFDYAMTTIVRLTDEPKAWILREALPGAAKVVTEGDFGARYEALRPNVPRGTDLVLVVGAGMEWTK